MYLAIDYGKKRIGLALGKVFPRGAGVVDGSQAVERVITDIVEIIEREKVEKVIIGLPIRSQGEEGEIAAPARQLGTALGEKTGLPVIYEPEQFTSSEAAEYLRSRGDKSTRESGRVDEIAAVLILEQYLNNHENTK